MLTRLQELDSLRSARVLLTDGTVVEGASWGIVSPEDDEMLDGDAVIFVPFSGGEAIDVTEKNLVSFEAL